MVASATVSVLAHERMPGAVNRVEREAVTCIERNYCNRVQTGVMAMHNNVAGRTFCEVDFARASGAAQTQVMLSRQLFSHDTAEASSNHTMLAQL